MEDSKEFFKKRKLHNKPPQFRGVVRAQESIKEPLVEVPKEEAVVETPIETKWKEDAPENVTWKVGVVKSEPVELAGFQAQKELSENKEPVAVDEQPLDENSLAEGSILGRVERALEEKKVSPQHAQSGSPVESAPITPIDEEVVSAQERPQVSGPLVEGKKPAGIKVLEKFSSALKTLFRRPKPELPPLPAGVKLDKPPLSSDLPIEPVSGVADAASASPRIRDMGYKLSNVPAIEKIGKKDESKGLGENKK